MQLITGASFRTGDEYRQALVDGRKVYFDGELIEDVTKHPLTAPVADVHAEWYDAHRNSDTAADYYTNRDPIDGEPLAFIDPKTPEELHAISDAIRRQAFSNGGNITHTPGFGSLMILGVWDTLATYGASEPASVARERRRDIANRQLFMTGVFTTLQTDRFRAPDDRLIPKVVKERDDGIVVRGGYSIGTGLVYGDEICSLVIPTPTVTDEQALWFSFPVNAEGTSYLLRRPSGERRDAFRYPLTSRFDELECAVVLDDVFVPWEQVYVYRDRDLIKYLSRALGWLYFSHMARMLARAEFTLGLARAVTAALTTDTIPGVGEHLTDLILHTETQRTALRAAAADSQLTPVGHALPDLIHLAVGTHYALSTQAQANETLRTLGGQSVVLAPSDTDFATPGIGSRLDEIFGGGPLSATQRSALACLIGDHTTSTLQAREAAFAALASGGLFTWRQRLRSAYRRIDDLAVGALAVLRDRTGVEITLERATERFEDPLGKTRSEGKF